MSQDLETDLPDIQEYGIDEEGPLPEEQLNTISVPVTLADIESDSLEAFLEYLKHSTCPIWNHENDYISEFNQARSFYLNIESFKLGHFI